MTMSTSPDSSRPHLYLVDAEPSRPPGADKARRTRLLTSERLHASIRKVARDRDVPEDEVDDILQETIARAWRAKLPDNDEEVPKYVNRIAVNVSCERMRMAPVIVPYVENPDEEQGEVATPIGVPPPCFETRDLVSRLIETGEQHFPKGFAGYVAAKATGGTANEIATIRGVTPGHVRHEWSDIQSLMKRRGRKMGVVLALVALALVVGNVWWPLGPELVSSPRPSHEPKPPLPLDAAGLRHRAQDECAARAWRACSNDLDAANESDPAGETRELRDLRTLAKQHLGAEPPQP